LTSFLEQNLDRQEDIRLWKASRTSPASPVFPQTRPPCPVRLRHATKETLTPRTAAPPDYYAALEIPATATASQIRDAYKRAALKHHPDRVPAASPERAARTRRFQLVNDAYYTLSDPGRRRDYDAARRFHEPGAQGGEEDDGGEEEEFEEVPRPGAMPGGFAWGGAAAGSADAQFGGAFEEMLRDEGLAEGTGAGARPTGLFWGVVGGVSGAALGFIVANLPGAVAGAVAGNRLGAVRDARGKSVYEVFQELPQEDKARLLADLATRMFSHAVGS
jgi:hypothetical protein